MMDKEKIRNIIELFIAWNGETEPIDIANLDSAVEFISNSLQEKHVSDKSEKENKIEILAHIIFDAAKSGYMDYNTQDEYCAMKIAKNNIDKLISQKS